MKRRMLLALLLVVLLAAAFSMAAPDAAYAHHAGLNPGIGNLNEEMVHNGLMERAADMGFWNQPWELAPTP